MKLSEIINIEAIFNFIADNPPSIAIAGAILMWLFAATMRGLNLHGADNLEFWSPIVFLCGIGLQIGWLFKKKR